MNGNLAHKHEENMENKKILSTKLGELEYVEDDIITMSSPILGFPDLHDFLLITSDQSFPFIWFQSTEDENICFILVEPEVFHPKYKPQFNKRDYKILNAETEKEIKIFGIVTVPDDPKKATVNLRAPLMVNTEKKLAKQIVLEDEKWEIKTPLFKNEEK